MSLSFPLYRCQHLFTDDSHSREQVMEKLDGVFEVLSAIGQCREKLEQLAQMHTPHADTPYTPLLEQVDGGYHGYGEKLSGKFFISTLFVVRAVVKGHTGSVEARSS